MTSERSATLRKTLMDYGIMTVGTTATALGVYFFKFPNNFSLGGVSGISVILSSLIKDEAWSSGLFMLILNMLLLIIGFIFVGNEFGIKTVYCSVLLSAETYLAEFIIPISSSLTGDKLLDLCFAILLPAIGAALLFNYGASTGGTDILAMVIRKHSSLNISKALMVSDIVIVMATAFVFGVDTWLYCCLGFFAKVVLVNNVLETLNTSKYMTIVTTEGTAVSDFITHELHKSATFSHAFEGAFTKEDKFVILTVVTRAQAIRLKKYIKNVDPHAFLIVSNTSDIVGKGFREVL